VAIEALIEEFIVYCQLYQKESYNECRVSIKSSQVNSDLRIELNWAKRDRYRIELIELNWIDTPVSTPAYNKKARRRHLYYQ